MILLFGFPNIVNSLAFVLRRYAKMDSAQISHCRLTIDHELFSHSLTQLLLYLYTCTKINGKRAGSKLS
jgi:hypothetical protein